MPHAFQRYDQRPGVRRAPGDPINISVRRIRVKRDGLPCCLCGEVSFRQVGRRGYCETHTAEAYADAAKRVSEKW